MTPTDHRRALLILIVGACIIGFSPILVRLSQAGPAATGFWRLAFALPLLTLMATRSTEKITTVIRAPVLLIAGFLFAADLGFWHYGIHFTSVANATVLSNLTPILVTGAAWLVLKEKPRHIFLLGMSLAVAGAIGMAVFKAGVGGAKPSYLGDGLSTLTAVWYGGYFLTVREARKRFSTTTLMVCTSIIGMPVLLIAAVLLHERIMPLALGGWAACLGLGLMHVTGQGAIAWALGRLPTALAAVVVLVQPVVAAALGWMVFGEAITPLQGVAALLALGGVAVAQWSARPPQPIEAPEV